MFCNAKIQKTHIGYDPDAHGNLKQCLSETDTVMGVVYADEADEGTLRLPSPQLILLSPVCGHSKITINVGRLVGITRL